MRVLRPASCEHVPRVRAADLRQAPPRRRACVLCAMRGRVGRPRRAAQRDEDRAGGRRGGGDDGGDVRRRRGHRSLALGILGGVFLPLPVSLVTAVVVERRLRRRFRPNPALPPATLRR